MKQYQPIPVETARQIAADYAKTQVVIVAWDPIFGQVHVTAYGVSGADKIQAARCGELCVAAVGGDPAQKTTFQDFREEFDAAQFKEALEILQQLRMDVAPSPTDAQRIQTLLQNRQAVLAERKEADEGSRP